MRKAEAKFQTEFNKYLREVYQKTCAVELKHTRGRNCLPFSEVKDHQIRALQIVNRGVFAYKISDFDMGYKPFDGFCLAGERAFIVIRYPRFFCMIPVETFVLERDRSTRKSLTSSRALDLSTCTVNC